MNTKQQIEIIPIFSRCFLIQMSEYIANIRHTQSLLVKLNRHAFQRSKERKINNSEIAAAILFGYSETKQGECFYAFTHEMLPYGYGGEFRRSDGLIVICDETSKVVKTCYRKKNPVIHIKKKKKYRTSHSKSIQVEDGKVIYMNSYHDVIPHISFFNSRRFA